jgi:membrane protein
MSRIKVILRNIFLLFRDAAIAWSTDRASIYAAALAYYTIFSLAPLLVFSVIIAGVVVSRTDVQNDLVMLVDRFAGRQISELVQSLIDATLASQRSSVVATIISFVVLLVGASAVFTQLKTALNKIWGIIPIPPQGWRGILFNIRTHAFSFLLVFGMGVLLLTFVITDTILTAINSALGHVFPNLPTLPPVTSFIAPLFILLFFAVIFKTLPDVQLRWRTVWWGALVTTVLFILGATIIGRVLVLTSTGSIYGAASSLIILLVWVYFSAQIVFFGAEFTKSFAIRFGASIQPRLHARLLHEFYDEFYSDLMGEVSRVDNHASTETGNAQPAAVPAVTEAATAGMISQRRAAFRQTAAALLGLAAGLLISFLSSLRRNR